MADNVSVKDASSTTVTARTKDCGGGVQAPFIVVGDTGGNMMPAGDVAARAISVTDAVKWLRGATEQTLLSTELNSLANNGTALGSAITLTDGLYPFADVTLVTGTFGSAPTANTGIDLWFLRETDGTNYEDGDNSTTPARPPDVVFPLRAVTAAQRVVRQVMVPPGTFKCLAKNDGSGQAMNASGNTIKLKLYTRQ